jgi:predicted enzyme related to lactoylglutathione lyase
MTGEVSFIEIGVDDVEKARAFYAELLGWKFEPYGERGGYTIETPSVPGGIHGGDPGASPYVFFRVDDLDAALQRVRELGGEVDPSLGDDSEETIERFGRFALCKDDQGSTFGLHQPPR